MELRLAELRDCRILFEYRNDPKVIETSLTKEPVAWADHCTWFEQKMAQGESLLYIAEVNGEPVGQVRLDKVDDVATVSYSIDSKHRGKGYGKDIIETIGKYAAERAIHKLVAVVRESNTASVHIFTVLGYEGTQQEGLIRFEKIISEGVHS